MPTLEVILLAGRIRPSPLSEALEMPALCLPMGRQGSLLHAWLDVLAPLPQLGSVQAVVNTTAEVDAVRFTAGGGSQSSSDQTPLHVIAEPSPWRGAAGIVRDVTLAMPRDSMVLVCEANRLPPRGLDLLVRTMCNAGPNVAGVIGVCGQDQPAGVYLFTREAMNRIPQIGYHDLKEQFLPALRRSGAQVGCCPMGDAVWRINDLESYLACVQQSLFDDTHRTRVHFNEHAAIATSAVFDGTCIVESGAIVEAGAVVHDSVVLWGATIGAGAVVSRCVIGSLARVSPQQRLTRSIVSPPALSDFTAVGGRFAERLTRASSQFELRREG